MFGCKKSSNLFEGLLAQNVFFLYAQNRHTFSAQRRQQIFEMSHSYQRRCRYCWADSLFEKRIEEMKALHFHSLIESG
jgi:hypothetical protein